MNIFANLFCCKTNRESANLTTAQVGLGPPLSLGQVSHLTRHSPMGQLINL